jgi:hypothetical protein
MVELAVIDLERSVAAGTWMRNRPLNQKLTNFEDDEFS